MREYNERWERLAFTTAVERTIPARDVPRGQSPMELITPRDFGLTTTTEVRVPTAAGGVTILDPSDALSDPVVEQTVQRLRETAGRPVASRIGNRILTSESTPLEISQTSTGNLDQEEMSELSPTTRLKT